jgi:hypothetical protein
MNRRRNAPWTLAYARADSHRSTVVNPAVTLGMGLGWDLCRVRRQCRDSRSPDWKAGSCRCLWEESQGHWVCIFVGDEIHDAPGIPPWCNLSNGASLPRDLDAGEELLKLCIDS